MMCIRFDRSNAILRCLTVSQESEKDAACLHFQKSSLQDRVPAILVGFGTLDFSVKMANTELPNVSDGEQ